MEIKTLKEEIVTFEKESMKERIINYLSYFSDEEKEEIMFAVMTNFYRKKYGFPDCVKVNRVSFVTPTTDFFEWNDRNREVKENRKNTTKTALKNKRQVNDIVLNENLEIIEGQSRTKAFEEINFEHKMNREDIQLIEFTIKDGLTIEDALNCNNSQIRWIFEDFIISKAADGSCKYQNDFQNLKSLMSDYGSSIGKTPIISMATGMLSNSGNGPVKKAIKDDYILLFNDREKEELQKYLNKICNILSSNKDFFKGIAHKDKLINAIYFLLKKEKFNEKCFISALKSLSKDDRNNMIQTGDFESCLDSAIEIYKESKTRGKRKQIDRDKIKEDFLIFNTKNKERYASKRLSKKEV